MTKTLRNALAALAILAGSLTIVTTTTEQPADAHGCYTIPTATYTHGATIRGYGSYGHACIAYLTVYCSNGYHRYGYDWYPSGGIGQVTLFCSPGARRTGISHYAVHA